MKQTMKPILMLLLVSLSYFVKGQPFVPSTYTAAGAGQQLESFPGMPTQFPVTTPDYLFVPSIGHYMQRIIAGDPNGQTGFTSNLADINSVGIGIPYKPFQLSIIQAYGGEVTNKDDSRSAITSMIRQNGIGLALGSLSTAGYQTITLQSPFPNFPLNTISTFGVQGEHKFNQFTLPLPNSSVASYTAGGFFRNSLVPQNAFLGNSIFSLPLQINAGAIGLITEQSNTPSGPSGASGLLGWDQTDNSYDVNKPGLNYAGVFFGRGWFSNRVGIGPATTTPLTANAAAPSHMLYVDGRQMVSQTVGNQFADNYGFVLRLEGVKRDETLDSFLVIDYEVDENNVRHGTVKYRSLPPPAECVCPTPPSQICNTNFNVNHGAGGASTALICGRIWDDGNGGSTTLGSNVGINTINTSQFFTVNGGAPAAINTGTVRTDGRFQMNGITPAVATEVLGIRPTNDPNSPNEVVRFTLPQNPNDGCNWTINGNGNNAFNINSTTAAPRGQINLTASCINNNFIGTRADNLPLGGATLPDANDLVFGTLGNGWMRLTTQGGLYLTDFSFANQVDNGNIKIGMFAGANNINNTGGFGGTFNVYVGHRSGSNTTTLNTTQNTFVGTFSGRNNQGSFNTFMGTLAGQNNRGGENTMIGVNAGNLNETGNQNVFLGRSAGNINVNGSNNVCVGWQSNTLGNNNTIVGHQACQSTANGATDNTIIGRQAGVITTGIRNTYLGRSAGNPNTNGNENIHIGFANGSPTSVSGCIGIGSNLVINNSQSIGIATCQNGVSNTFSGTNFIRIGSNLNPANAAFNLAVNGIAIGTDAQSSSSISLGVNTISAANGTAIGNNANANAPNAIAIGTNAIANAVGSGIALGNVANATGFNSVALGSNSRALQEQSTAIGFNAIAMDHNSYAIGTNCISQGERILSIGEYVPAATPAALQTVNLDPRWLRVGIGTGTITAQMTASGVPIPANSYATTRFHVKCDNLPNLPTVGSGIRFENLQVRNGCPNGGVSNLVIDRLGYVYADEVLCGTYPRMANPETSNNKTDSLQKQIDELKEIIAIMAKDVEKCCSKTGSSPVEDFPMSKDNKLYQNVPNPFTIGTEIKFFVPETVKVASLIIYDLNGREIRKIDINERNESSIKIQGKELAAGMYIYSLIADSKEVDSKRMILTGN